MKTRLLVKVIIGLVMIGLVGMPAYAERELNTQKAEAFEGSKGTNDLRLWITCDKDTYAVGEPITIELRLHNTKAGEGQSYSDPKIWVRSDQVMCTGFRISDVSGGEEIAGLLWPTDVGNMPWPPGSDYLIRLHPGHFWGCSFTLRPGSSPSIPIHGKETGRIFHVRAAGRTMCVGLIQKPGKYSVTAVRDLVGTIRFTGTSAPRKLVSERIESNTLSISIVEE